MPKPTSPEADGALARALSSVSSRLWLARVARLASHALYIAAGLFLVALLISRLTALLPGQLFHPAAALALPALALLAALALARWPSRLEAARTIDRAAGADDLFLTAQLLSTPPQPAQGSPRPHAAPAPFAPIVASQAQARAASLDARSLVPWQPWPRLASSAALIGALALASLTIPQLDLLGHGADQAAQQQRVEALEARRALTDLARAKTELPKPETTPASQAVDQLLKALSEARLDRPEQNQQAIQQQRQQLAELWRDSDAARRAEALRQLQSGQSFGGANRELQDAIREALESADTSALQESVQQAAEEVADAASQREQDPAASSRQLAQSQRSLAELADALERAGADPALADALRRAIEQIDMSALDGLGDQAIADALDSLELSQELLEQMAQALADAQALEQALETLQLAQQLNQMGQLDGAQCEGCTSLAEYAERFREMMAAQGLAQGQGAGQGQGGTGGEGQGQGGIVPEDDSQDSGFLAAREQARATEGRKLLEWKVSGLSQPGEVTEEYAAAVEELHRGLTEAIENEQIPSAHHESIRRYFDTITTPPPAP